MFLKTLLLVEDDPDIAAVLRMSLDLSRYEVETAADLATARALIAQKPPDLVILDVGLPDGSGLDLCREVKAARPGLPVIILTALSRRQRGLEAHAWASGADAFVEKPFDPDDLQAMAERLLAAA
jgi:DNA-binding response OmpR family regulator